MNKKNILEYPPNTKIKFEFSTGIERTTIG